MLTDFIRPLVAALLWVVVAAFTLVELATVAPALGRNQGRSLQPPAVHARHGAEARISRASARW